MRIGTFAGIRVYIHATFLILVAWILGSYILSGQSVLRALAGLGFVLILFLCVLLHEFGHALTARRFGINTRDITLLPIGGVARLDRLPEKPTEELLVAVAGPAVNLVIAGVLTTIIFASRSADLLFHVNLIKGQLLPRLLWLNVVLAVFNMVPAFPMDGGRVLRAFLAMRIGRVRATEVAAAIGQALAILFGIVGLLANPLLIFIAFFVWIGASAEAADVRAMALLHNLHVRDLMVTAFARLESHQPVGQLRDLLLAGFQSDFPVFEGGQLAGFVTRRDIVSALNSGDPGETLDQIVNPSFATAGPDEPADEAVRRWRQTSDPVLAVVDDGKLVGMLTANALMDFATIARNRSRPPIA